MGPGPFAAMLFSDMGADVIRIDRKGGRAPHKTEITYRGRRAVALDLKKPEAVEAALKLIEKADALIEGFRPGVMERLGVGPDVCLARNPKPRLWPHDRLGAERAAGQRRRPRHQLHRDHAARCTPSARKDAPSCRSISSAISAAARLYLAFGMVCAMLEARYIRQRAGRGRGDDATARPR